MSKEDVMLWQLIPRLMEPRVAKAFPENSLAVLLSAAATIQSLPCYYHNEPVHCVRVLVCVCARVCVHVCVCVCVRACVCI